MDLTIREANTEDAKDLSELFFEFVGKETNLDKLRIKLDFLSMQPNYYVAVACLDNQVIGSAMGLVCPDIVGDCRPYLLVENVVVSISHQGKGIGKQLMNTLEEYADQHDCAYVILASSNHRINAHKFYESIGYQGTKRGFIKDL